MTRGRGKGFLVISIVNAHRNHPLLTNIKCFLCPPLLFFTSFFLSSSFLSLQLPFYRCHPSSLSITLCIQPLRFRPFLHSLSLSLSHSLSLTNSFPCPPLSLFTLHSSLFLLLSLLSHSLFPRFCTSTHCLFTTLSSHFLQHFIRPSLLPSTLATAPPRHSTPQRVLCLSVGRSLGETILSLPLSQQLTNQPVIISVNLAGYHAITIFTHSTPKQHSSNNNNIRDDGGAESTYTYSSRAVSQDPQGCQIRPGIYTPPTPTTSLHSL